MRMIILGSGATHGTIRGCPTIDGFGRVLGDRRSDWRYVYPALARAVGDLRRENPSEADNWSLRDLWMRLDYYAKLHPALGTSGYGAQASCELHKAVLDVYGKPAVDRAAQLYDQGKSFTLLAVLSQLMEGDVLVSFNWDVVAEVLLERLNRPVVQAPYPAARNIIQLVKPHGSVSWPHFLGMKVEFHLPDGRPRITSLRPADVGVGTVEPFLLGAVPIKSELIREVQAASHTNAYEVVMSQWHALVEAVRQADEIVVVGYSFPGDDGYGRFLFSEAVQSRGPRRIESVEFYEKSECKPKERMRFVLQGIFNPLTEPNWVGEVTSPDTANQGLSRTA